MATVTEPSKLSPAEDAKRYREMAEDAHRKAVKTRGAARETHQFIAETWEKLAANQDANSKAQEWRAVVIVASVTRQ